MSRLSIKSFFADKMKDKNIEIILVNIIIQLYLFRTTLPVFKYAFIGLFPLGFLYIIYRNRNKIVKSLWETIGQLKWVIILITLFFIAFVFYGRFYEIILVDLINAIVLVVLFYLIILPLENKTQLDYFILVFIHLVLVSALLIIISQWASLVILSQNKTNTSEVIDRNFALLPLFFSLFGIFFLYNKKQLTGMLNLSYTALLVLLTLHIFLSGSRRGLILISVFISILILIHIISLISANLCIKRISRASRFYTLSLICLVSILYISVFYTSCRFKNRTIEYFGAENIQNTKSDITMIFYSYVSLYKKDIKYLDLYNKIWTPNFDSRYPDSGWGIIYTKTVFPLSGQYVEIVPEEAEGCYIEPNSFKSYDTKVLDIKIKELKVNLNEEYKASIYCYVSNDFGEGSIRYMLGWAAINDNVVNYNSIAYYDLSKKATWQKLSISFNCNEGVIPIYLSISAKDEKKFSELNGFVILAYPEVHKIDINGNKDSIALNLGNKDEQVLFKSSLINIESWFKSFNRQNEDTTSLNIERDIEIEHDPNHVIQGRTHRWQFAWYIFKSKYNWKQKFFGKGFDYLRWYGEYFHNDPKRSDWPHNPFLSVLLYSGILGLAFYLFVFYKAVYYYIKYIKEYYIFFIFFLITFFFSFFSSNSPFTPPVMGFLLIFPFFLHSVLKKEKLEKNAEKD